MNYKFIAISCGGFIRNLVVFCAVTLSLSIAQGQQRSEPTGDDRVAQSMSQLSAALIVKRGLAEDKECTSNKYEDIDLGDYISLVMKVDGDASSNKKSKIDGLAKMLDQAINAKLPDGRIVWKANYELIRKNMTNKAQTLGQSSVSICDALNNAAESLYSKSKDNVRLYNK